jgi:Uma2 family endonuclease
VLSPDDRYTRVIQRCRRYAEWGVKDILVFDPVGREAWCWDTTNSDLLRVKTRYAFSSRPAELFLDEVFRRMDEETENGV